MNSLESLTIREEVITTPGGEFTVGALSAAAIIGIFSRHRTTLGELFTRYKAQQETADVALALIGEAPDIAAEIIVGACGEFSQTAMVIARRLDFGTQIKALEAIAKLTTEGHGGLGNLVAVVLRAAEAATGSLKQSQGKMT